jgi:hypothetical protein
MTLERASELVIALNNLDRLKRIETGEMGTNAPDLFAHFVDYFKMRDEQIMEFAELCGFNILNEIKSF